MFNSTVPSRVADLAAEIEQRNLHAEVTGLGISHRSPQVGDFHSRDAGASGGPNVPHLATVPGPVPDEANGAIPKTDSEVFSFLAGVSPSRPQTNWQVPGGPESSGMHATSPDVMRSDTNFPYEHTQERVLSPPGLETSGVVETAPATLNHADLSMLLKSIQTFVPQLPKLELGDILTRAQRFLSWKVAVDQALIPCGPHLQAWWRWVVDKSAMSYKLLLRASASEKQKVFPTAELPMQWIQLDS